MINKTIDWCNNNRFLVGLLLVGVVLAGVWSLNRIPLDALPDISDVEVIIHTEWMGEPPDIIEDQVTYPIISAMTGCGVAKLNRNDPAPPSPNAGPSTTVTCARSVMSSPGEPSSSIALQFSHAR